MNRQIIQRCEVKPNEVKPNLSQPTIPSGRDRGMAASWFVVDGRLVCKWFPREE